MKYYIIGICVALIVLAIVIFIKKIIKMSKGNCCEGCNNCSHKQQCSNKLNSENEE